MSEQVKASHILVKTEDEAKKLKEQIKNKDDFAQMAKKVSLCPSGANGGDLGWFSRGMMVKPFEDTAFNMKIGEISAPVQTQFGFHLLYLEDKKN